MEDQIGLLEEIRDHLEGQGQFVAVQQHDIRLLLTEQQDALATLQNQESYLLAISIAVALLYGAALAYFMVKAFIVKNIWT